MVATFPFSVAGYWGISPKSVKPIKGNGTQNDLNWRGLQGGLQKPGISRGDIAQPNLQG